MGTRERRQSLPTMLEQLTRALVNQCNEIAAEVEASSDFDKKLVDRLCEMAKSIEKLIELGQQLDRSETEYAVATEDEMRQFMKAVDDRIAALANEKAEEVVAKTTNWHCPRCGAEFWKVDPTQSASTT